MKKLDGFISSFIETLSSKIEMQPNSLPLAYVENFENASLRFYEDHILVETKSVFRRKDLSRLSQMLLNMEDESIAVYSREDLVKIQTLSKFGAWIKPRKKLGVIKSSFESFSSFCQHVKKLTGYDDEQKLADPFSDLKLGRAMYMPFSQEIGILFINSKKMSEEVVCHELIHFLQDVTGQGMAMAKENEKFSPIEQLARLNDLETFGTIDRKLAKLVISEHEIVPYMNSLCYLMEKNNVEADVPRKMLNNLIKFTQELKRRNGTLRELKEAILSNACLAGLKKADFAFLVICLLYGQHLELLKRTFGNYFKDN